MPIDAEEQRRRDEQRHRQIEALRQYITQLSEQREWSPTIPLPTTEDGQSDHVKAKRPKRLRRLTPWRNAERGLEKRQEPSRQPEKPHEPDWTSSTGTESDVRARQIEALRRYITQLSEQREWSPTIPLPTTEDGQSDRSETPTRPSRVRRPFRWRRRLQEPKEPHQLGQAVEQPWFLTDEPIRHRSSDEFHHQDVAEQLREIIEVHAPPDVIGLIGPFGTGKSSVAELLVRIFEGNKQRRAVRLSADKHTGVERQRALVYGLADALADNRILTRRNRDKLLRPLATSTQRATIDPITLVRTIGLAIGSLLAIYLLGVVLAGFLHPRRISPWVWPSTDPWNKISLPIAMLVFLAGFLKVTVTVSRLEAADEIERVFRSLIERCHKELERLVVIVDDIDRLPPNQVLEAVTTIRSLKHEQRRRSDQGSERRVVFVVACDEGVLRQALADADPGLSSVGGSTELAAAEYLEKLFAVRRYMPPHLLINMRAYARKRLEDVDLQSRTAVLQSIPILVHPGVRTPRHVIRLINALIADFRLAFAREQKSTGMAKDEVTKHPSVLARLTVLRVDFPETYRQIAEDPLLLPALDAYVEDPHSLDEVSRRRVATFFHGSGVSGEVRVQDIGPGAILPEGEAGLTVPPDCLPVIEFLKATSEAAGRVGSLDPFFYLGQAPNEVILGSTVFGGIRDALKNNDPPALADLLQSLRTEPKSMQAAVDTIIDELKEITDVRTLSAYVRTCIDMLAQSSLVRTEECQRLAGELVLRVDERPRMQLDSDRLARLIALSPPSNMQENLMRRLDNFDGDLKKANHQALAIYQLAIERKPSGYDHRSTLVTYFRDVVGMTHLTSLEPQLDIEGADAKLRFGKIADSWLRMAFENGQQQCDYVLGEEFYLFVLRMIMKEENTARRLRLALGLSKLVQSSALATRSRTLRELVWLCLRADDLSLRWCAVRILTHLKLVDDDFGRLLEVLPLVMDLETIAYPETVVDFVDLVGEWSSTIAHAGGRSEGDTLYRQRVAEIIGVASQRREELMRSLVEGGEARNVTFEPDLLIAALLRLRVQAYREHDLFAQVVNQALRSEQEATLELPSEVVLRAITLCSQVIESHTELPGPLREAVLDALAMLLRSDDPIEARRLVQAWRNLLAGDGHKVPRQQIIAAMKRVAMTVPEAVHDVMEDIAGPLEGWSVDDSKASPESRRVQ